MKIHEQIQNDEPYHFWPNTSIPSYFLLSCAYSLVCLIRLSRPMSKCRMMTTQVLDWDQRHLDEGWKVLGLRLQEQAVDLNGDNALRPQIGIDLNWFAVVIRNWQVVQLRPVGLPYVPEIGDVILHLVRVSLLSRIDWRQGSHTLHNPSIVSSSLWLRLRYWSCGNLTWRMNLISLWS